MANPDGYATTHVPDLEGEGRVKYLIFVKLKSSLKTWSLLCSPPDMKKRGGTGGLPPEP